MTERVLFPAIKTGDGQFSVTNSFGNGHSSIISHLIGAGASGVVDMDNLGFVTSSGRFVSREEAKTIANRSGQLVEGAYNNGPLFSNQMKENTTN